MDTHCKIATRGSKMALAQAELIAAALKREHSNLDPQIAQISTIGCRKQETPEASTSDKRDWIHDLELSVIKGETDLAQHCGKDVPAVISNETCLYPIFKRGNPADIFIGCFDNNLGRRIQFSEVPQGGVIGTASLRRKAQLLMLRPDVSVVEHRGNVPTRIEKLDNNPALSGIVLSHAGLDMLKLDELPRDAFSFWDFVPAVNQGILVAQVRKDREDLRELLKPLQDAETVAEFVAERTCVEVLNGDCNSAIGLFARANGDHILLRARVMLPDGTQCIESSRSRKVEDAILLGQEVADELLSQGAREILNQSSR